MSEPRTAARTAPVGSQTFAGLRAHPLVQLTLVRIREFAREPEAVFWAIFFPILLAAGLGIAFRGGPGERLTVASTDARLAESMRSDPGLDVEVLPRDAALVALRNGRVALVVEQ